MTAKPSEARRPRGSSPGRSPEQRKTEQQIEEGYSADVRARVVEDHARRLQKFSGLAPQQARRIAEAQTGRAAPRHGRRGLGVPTSATYNAMHGTMWERKGVRPPVSENEQGVPNQELDRRLQLRTTRQHAAEERQLVRNRGRRRRRADTAPSGAAKDKAVRSSHVEDEEDLEGGRYPQKPTLKILDLVDIGPMPEKGKEEPEEESEEEEDGEGSPRSRRTPYDSCIARRAAAREEEFRLIHHAFITAKAHKTAACAALDKVPDEALSGESQFDLASFMRSTVER